MAYEGVGNGGGRVQAKGGLGLATGALGGGAAGTQTQREVVYYEPSWDSGGGLNDNPAWSGGGGGGVSAADQRAIEAEARAVAAENAAKAAGKSQTAKQNEQTQKIIDALLGTLTGMTSGRDQLFRNAEAVLKNSLSGVQANYEQAVGDYLKTATSNEQDEASKSAANVSNRARERMSLLEQAASQGAGETDQLRAQLQAFNNFDANQLEVTRAFYDTQRQINGQIAGANSQAETSRRNAWNSLQDAKGAAYTDWAKNSMDIWTNVQRTAAGNTNIDSDYSTKFDAQFGGKDPVAEAAALAGKVYSREEKDDQWYGQWDRKSDGTKTKTTASERAAAVTINAPKAAEGALLRRKA